MSATTADRIRDFMSQGPYAVVGASRHPDKFGNKVLRAYLRHHLQVYAVNPRETEIEGLTAYPDLQSLPTRVRGISVITPRVTEQVVEEAARAGVEFVWMQPGAESPEAVRRAEALGLKVIADGSCFLVVNG